MRFLPILLVLVAAGCNQAARDADRAAAAVARCQRLLLDAASITDVGRRLAILEQAKAALPPSAGTREVRWALFEVEGLIADVHELQGLTEEAQTGRERRFAQAATFLQADPGDGHLRGELAYGLLVAGREDEGWATVVGGLAAADHVPALDRVLVQRARLFPLWWQAQGKDDRARQRAAQLADFIRSLRDRATARGEDPAWIIELLGIEGRQLVFLGRTAEATRVAAQIEALDPASLQAFEIRKVLEPPPPTGR